jgi:hypothetical protein
MFELYSDPYFQLLLAVLIAGVLLGVVIGWGSREIWERRHGAEFIPCDDCPLEGDPE